MYLIVVQPVDLRIMSLTAVFLHRVLLRSFFIPSILWDLVRFNNIIFHLSCLCRFDTQLLKECYESFKLPSSIIKQELTFRHQSYSFSPYRDRDSLSRHLQRSKPTAIEQC